jgi:hypothetical protein
MAIEKPGARQSFVVDVNYDLWINLLRSVKWVADPGDTFERGE